MATTRPILGELFCALCRYIGLIEILSPVEDCSPLIQYAPPDAWQDAQVNDTLVAVRTHVLYGYPSGLTFPEVILWGFVSCHFDAGCDCYLAISWCVLS
jgi:hypothetical protein